MKWLQVLVVTGAVLGLTSAKPQQVEGQCEEGTYNKDCNTCICKNGREICTLMACLPEEQRLPDNATCLPGSRWKNDCNWCSCTETGIPLCTLKGCVPDYEPEPGEPVCLGNSRWLLDECNWCSCRNGVPGCTRKMCPRQAQALCVEGTSYNKDCNTCTCRNGMEMCTLMACLSGRR